MVLHLSHMEFFPRKIMIVLFPNIKSSCFSNQKVDHGKSRKERKPGKKGGSADAANSNGLEGVPPDVGALCI